MMLNRFARPRPSTAAVEQAIRILRKALKAR